MQNSVLIDTIAIYKLFIPLKEPFVISLGPIYNAENVMVVINTNTGLTGYGECSPYKTINGESVDTCFIVGQYLAKALKGANALDVEQCSLLMDKVIYGNSSIKSAFDMALYDIAAQYAGQPLYRFLGGTSKKELITDMTVSIGPAEKMKNDAVAFQQMGFQVIKVKLGEDKEKDVERIKAIRNGIGYDLPLRIDANQGWQNASNAIDILQALKPYHIQHCEEPIPRWRFMDLNQVARASPIPIMADESCCDHHDAERLIQLKACTLLNIKLGKSGGFYKALKMIDLADEAHLQLQIGGFMESRLGMTAAAHLALTNKQIRYCDFDTPLMFTEDPVTGGINYKSNGVIEVPDKPGLGAAIDQAYLHSSEKIVL